MEIKTRVIKVNKLTAFLVLLICGLTACKEAPYYADTYVFTNGVWGSGEMPSFSFEANDSLGRYDMSFVLRLNNDYDYQNMWILMHTTLPEGTISTDTINLQVCDEKGRWLGKKSGATYTFTGLFAYQHRFETLGEYKIRMEHAVMNPELKGVLDMTLLVEHSKN